MFTQFLNDFYFIGIFILLCVLILINPPSMKRRRDVAFRSYIGPDVADHAKTSSRRRNWYVNETDVFEPSLRRVVGT